jgi:hypothetical protein
MTYLELRAAIARDPVVGPQIGAFTKRIGSDKTKEFWRGVEKQNFGSVSDFGNLFAMQDDEILEYLKSPAERTRDALLQHLKREWAKGAIRHWVAPQIGAGPMLPS